MKFSDRLKLALYYDMWRRAMEKRREVSIDNSALNVITFLDMIGALKSGGPPNPKLLLKNLENGDERKNSDS